MSRKSLLYGLVLSPAVAGLALLFLPPQGAPATVGGTAMGAGELGGGQAGPDRLVFLLQYLGTDYAVAVRDGQVISEFEYNEMLDFSGVLLEEYGRVSAGGELTPAFARLRRMIVDRADPGAVRELATELVPQLTEEFGVVAFPTLRPRIERGARLYAESCQRCHGADGGGDGPAVVDMEPEPRSFRDSRMNRLAPYQLYNAVTFGVDGTAMPGFGDGLSRREIWDLAFYVMTLRDGFDPGPEPDTRLSLRQLATRSNAELLEGSDAAGLRLEHLDRLRSDPPGPSPRELIARAREMADDSFESYRQGEGARAVDLSLAAYLEGVEPVEPELARLDFALGRDLERRFGAYRAALRSGAAPEVVEGRLDGLRRALGRASDTLASSDAGWGLALVQSAAIILREGIEAALLLGLVITYLLTAGHRRLVRPVVGGAVMGLVAGVGTWFAARYLLEISPLQQEALEGITSLLAAAVLFSVSLWVIHHADVERWKGYIRERTEEALGVRGGIALVSVAFLAVYREAFETVLFYQAMWLRGAGQRPAIVSGFVVGSAVLLVLVVAMFRFGLRIPLKPFFAITGTLLGLLCVLFAGYGVRELQNIGWIKETPLDALPAVPLLEVWPTAEGMALQAGIVASFLLGWWAARHWQELVPAADPGTAARDAAAS